MQTIGVAVLLIVAASAVTLLVRGARTHGILAPVLWGGGLRLGVMVAAHVISSLAGDGGFQYLDDRGYSMVGEILADQWRSNTPPSALEPAGILPHGGPIFYHLTGLLTLATGDSVIPLKLANVLLGTATILFAALLAERILGPWATRRTAWIVALAPTIVWWAAPMLKEQLVVAMLTATLVVATRLPSRRAVAGVVALLALLCLTRFPIFLAAAIPIIGYLGLVSFGESRREGRLAIAPVAAMVVVSVLSVGLGFWVTSSSTGSTARAAEVVRSTVELGRTQNRESPGASTFESPLATSAADNRLGATVTAFSRFTLSPRPWAFADQPLDWYQPLFPAMWLWYALLPVAAVGLWRLRSRPTALLVVGPIAVAAAVYSATLASGVRQRSAIEPLLVLLVVAGFHSRRALGLSVASALVVVAPVAALDLRSLPVGLAILLVAGVIALATLRGWYPGAAATGVQPRQPHGAGL
jgi:hypothetical protein